MRGREYNVWRRHREVFRGDVDVLRRNLDVLRRNVDVTGRNLEGLRRLRSGPRTRGRGADDARRSRRLQRRQGRDRRDGWGRGKLEFRGCERDERTAGAGQYEGTSSGERSEVREACASRCEERFDSHGDLFAREQRAGRDQRVRGHAHLAGEPPQRLGITGHFGVARDHHVIGGDLAFESDLAAHEPHQRIEPEGALDGALDEVRVVVEAPQVGVLVDDQVFDGFEAAVRRQLGRDKDDGTLETDCDRLTSPGREPDPRIGSTFQRYHHLVAQSRYRDSFRC